MSSGLLYNRISMDTGEHSFLCVDCICVFIQTVFAAEKLRAHFYTGLKTCLTSVYCLYVPLKRLTGEDCFIAQWTTINGSFAVFVSRMQLQVELPVENHGTLHALERDFGGMNAFNVWDLSRMKIFASTSETNIQAILGQYVTQ